MTVVQIEKEETLKKDKTNNNIAKSQKHKTVQKKVK